MYLKKFRESLKLSQKEVADRLDIAPSALARYEKGKVTPTAPIIGKYVELFDANANYLILGIEPKILDNDTTNLVKEIEPKTLDNHTTSSVEKKEPKMLDNDTTHKINTKLSVKYLTEELNLKNEAELAKKLNISRSSLSMIKKRNSLGTLIEKVLIHIDENVSMDKLVYGYDSKCFKAQTIAINNQKEDDLRKILDNFIDSQTIIEKIKTKIQRSKNLEFLEKLKDFTNETYEEMLNLFYSILIELEKSQLIITDSDLNEKFSNIVESSINLYTDNQNIEIDSSEFKHWINSELDNTSIIEILLSLNDLKDIIEQR